MSELSTMTHLSWVAPHAVAHSFIELGKIVVHVFTDEARKFYDLERLWADAEVVDLTDVVLPD